MKTIVSKGQLPPLRYHIAEMLNNIPTKKLAVSRLAACVHDDISHVSIVLPST